ncbi:hypothetical protein HZH68_011555 [Vespula germanica]|uniref:Uncharacterized protein n=1 Tax=Vespula germanica TaxID=30212 RepID=A0A834N0K9_VESGE|nr:hypothetical protein HZH68_011555 [Vespula germanica]
MYTVASMCTVRSPSKMMSSVTRSLLKEMELKGDTLGKDKSETLADKVLMGSYWIQALWLLPEKRELIPFMGTAVLLAISR